MISQSKIKLINSLAKKKYRDTNKLFIAEGEKLVNDLIDSPVYIKWIFACTEWLDANDKVFDSEVFETDVHHLKKISQLKTAPPVIAICEIANNKINTTALNNSLTLVLDGIQDPGNLGTIIRLADWFGIENIICSRDTVDAYNPKVIQATMGAIARVNIFYIELDEFLKKKRTEHLPIYGTFLDGEDIYSKPLSDHGIIIMGNEGKGISPLIETFVSEKLLIPSFTTSKNFSESLNVSTATAITLSEFKRRVNKK